jgi:hypothetical protein
MSEIQVTLGGRSLTEEGEQKKEVKRISMVDVFSV